MSQMRSHYCGLVTEALMGQVAVVAPVLTYLFHRLEERFDGRPTLLILDEAWIFLDHPLFAARIREWLKTLRKKNVAVLFATQSLADIADSSIAPAIIESCPQRILLPNDRAIEPQSRAAYARFGLNDRQIELVSRATPKRHYYLQSARGNRLFELGLGPIGLALCGASDPGSQARIDALVAEHGTGDFAARFLSGLGLGGLAFALAAQDTIANLFGSIVVAIDQPFKVGETVKIGANTGTVEDIGLRSTKPARS